MGFYILAKHHVFTNFTPAEDHSAPRWRHFLGLCVTGIQFSAEYLEQTMASVSVDSRIECFE